MFKPLVIIFSGIDGSGKSTHARLLYKYAKLKGLKVRYIWLRFFALITYPLFLYARLFKRTILVNVPYVAKVHIFWIDPVLKFLYPRLLLLDILIRFFIELMLTYVKRIDLLIIDRFVMDTAIDLIYETRDPSFLKSLIARTSLALLSKYHYGLLTFIADPHVIVERKKDILSLKEITTKYCLYGIFAERLLNIRPWNTTYVSVSDTVKFVLRHFHKSVGTKEVF